MGFNFNPTLWFVCRFCRHSFASTETLKEHKLTCHLGECMGIKCIVFEERLLDTEWNPEHHFHKKGTGTLNTNRGNRTSLKSRRNKILLIDDNSARESSFKNPYILLTRLTEQEINTASNENTDKRQRRCRRKPQRLQDSFKSEAAKGKVGASSKRRLPRANRNSTDDDYGSRDLYNEGDGSESEESRKNENLEVDIPDSILKIESPPYEEFTPENSIANEDDCSNMQDVEDREFIEANVSLDYDEVPQVESVSTSTSISASTQEYQTISNADLDHDTSIADSELQDPISDNDNDCSSELTDVKIKLDTYDFDGPDTTATTETQDQDPEPDSSDSIEYRESTALLDCQSNTEIREASANPFMCETCFLSFGTRDLLNIHMVSHPSVRTLKCSMCPSMFKRSADLTRHLVVHCKPPPRHQTVYSKPSYYTQFKCRFCIKSFTEKRTLDIHEKIHGTGVKPFKCPFDECTYATSSNCDLASHTRARHGEELKTKRFYCTHLKCGKTYDSSSHLEAHIRIIHSGIKPFRCTHEECSMEFKLERNLQMHLKMHHT